MAAIGSSTFMSRRSFSKVAAAAAGTAGAIALGAAAPALADEQSGRADGEYLGVGNGRGGALVVRVAVEGGRISSVEVVAENETVHVGTVALDELPSLIVESQSVDVEPVAGATITSMALLAAVEDALAKAGGDLADFRKEHVAAAAPSMETEADVVVVGSGGAGLSAAIRAAQAGAKVVVLEKEGVVGGTSNFSIEGYGSVGDRVHQALGCPLDAEGQAAGLAKTYDGKGDPAALEVFAQNEGPQADWLRSIGAELSCAGSQASLATTRECGRLGVAVMVALHEEALKQGVDIRVNSTATGLVTGADGAVAGVEVSTAAGDYQIACGAVVLAAGGYAASKDLLARFHPGYEALDFSCGCGSTGDGILMAEAAGAQLADTDYVRVNFTYATAPNGYYYYVGSLFNTGAIFVNADGKRFVNDQGGYGVGPTVVEQTGGSGWAVFDDSICKCGGDVRALGKLGMFIDADSLEELAEKAGIDKDGLLATVEAYKGYVEAGEDPEFGRAMLNMTFDEPPFHACPTMCRAQGTFGGIKCDADAQALDASGQPIPGLYAVGENAVIGTYGANPASVNVVFGSIAGTNAAAHALG